MRVNIFVGIWILSMSQNRPKQKKTLQMATFLKLHLKCSLKMEVPARFELANESFADSCLTTWPRYHMKLGTLGVPNLFLGEGDEARLRFASQN